MSNIYFPNLNLYFNIDPVAFNVFGIEIYWYGIILTTGILLGLLLAMDIAKKEGLNSDIVLDFLLYDIVFAILGARLYFIIFNWQYYMDHLGEIFNIRQGGIAIYGAIIASLIVAVIYTRRKKINFFKFADITAFGLILGQAIGRYGNFVNKEAFGDYTNNFFAMCLLKSEAKIPYYGEQQPEYLKNIVNMKGAEYIQVHPTFLYESCWNLLFLVILLVYRKHKKFEGEIFCLYLISYGIGRFWIEGLRTDQLIVNFINLPASQIVAIMSIIAGIIGIIVGRKNYKNSNLTKKCK